MKKIFTLIALHFALLTFAQPGTIDTSFNPVDPGFGKGDSTNSTVYSTVVQSDGKIIIAGAFTSYNGTYQNRIARLNADGSLDTSFKSGEGPKADMTSPDIRSMSVQSNGKIIIGGDFTSYDGVARNHIARLNSDGSLDPSFNPGTGANWIVFDSSIQSDGKIIIGGWFTAYNGINRNGIARLNSDGSLDTSFNPGTGTNEGHPRAISVQPDGKIIIGGSFKGYNGVAVKNFVRLNSDGSLDTGFIKGTGFDSYNIYAISLQSDGKIIVGGDFYSYNGIARSSIARLNADGTLDMSFDPGSGAYGYVRCSSIQSDGKIIIGGGFVNYNGTAVKHIARLNADGTLDTGFKVGSGIDNTMASSSFQSDGKIIIYGGFYSYNGIARNNIARLNADGSLDTNFNPGKGASSLVMASMLQSDGKIIIGGDFLSYNGVAGNHIARLNSDGSFDADFNTGLGTNGRIETLLIQPDDKIIINGSFSSYNGVDRNQSARLNVDGSLDTSFYPRKALNNNSPDPIHGVSYRTSLQSDGKIVIGGRFTSYDNVNRNNIARLNSDGSLDMSFNPGIGTDSTVNSIAIQSDGKIIIGGSFSSYNGTNIKNMARLNSDGSLDTSFNPGVGTDGNIGIILVQPDGKIIIGGSFKTYNGVLRNGIARLNSEGSLDSSFNIGTGFKGGLAYFNISLQLQPNGKIIVAGDFTSFNDTARNKLARLNTDGSLDASFNSGIGVNGESYPGIFTTSLQPDGKIIIGGYFTSYDGIGRHRIARINGDTPSLGLNENEFAKSIQLYPNPVSDILTIETQEKIAPEVEIYDLLGKSVKTLTSFSKRVDVSSLSSGVYIINVTDGKNGVYSSKFIKN